jgi:competence protein ComGC
MQPEQQSKGLAITSLVFGILGMICLGLFAGVPAIIMGHIARGRSQKNPAQYGGAGLALTGLILGYLSIVMTIVFVAIYAAMLLPALAKAKERAQRINCVNNLKQVGLAARMWAMEHNDQYPFNVSTATGGTLELCNLDADGFEVDAAVHFQVLSNELNTPKILVCVSDTKQAAFSFAVLTAANVSYKIGSGTNLSEANPTEVLAVCPFHNNILHCDGSVDYKRSGSKR